MVTTLNSVCILAICAAGLSGVKFCTTVVSGVRIQTMVKIIVPMILKVKWIMVVRLAFLLVPMDARTAVMQVPIF